MPLRRPIIAHAIGCPAGVAPELAAHVATDREIGEISRLVFIGDRRVLERGAACIGKRLDLHEIRVGQDIAQLEGPSIIDLGNLDPDAIVTGKLSDAAGRAALHNFVAGIGLARSGKVDALTFSPFNKAAMRLAHADYTDEIDFVRRHLGGAYEGAEYNILPGLWNARVTSHVHLSSVAMTITRDRVRQKLVETHGALRASGIASPRILVAGLNPHAGDNGSFGREEIDQIGPAIADARALGIRCEGPYASDTVFLKARDERFDCVLTMYHDQGQIAMKFMNFREGVTLLGGFPFPIVTPSHGSAYDIAHRGKSSPAGMLRATRLAVEMARNLAGKSLPESTAPAV